MKNIVLGNARRLGLRVADLGRTSFMLLRPLRPVKHSSSLQGMNALLGQHSSLESSVTLNQPAEGKTLAGALGMPHSRGNGALS
jgi:hypothetical protein